MTIDDQIKDEKLQYNINREAAKISALSSGKIYKYEYLAGGRYITIKPTTNNWKQVDALNTLKSDNNKKLEIKNEDIIPENAFASDEAKKEIDKILKLEKNADREKLVYNAGKYKYDFRKFNTIRTFGEGICNEKITLEEADEDQSDSVDKINEFTKKTRPQNDKKKTKKINC